MPYLGRGGMPSFGGGGGLGTPDINGNNEENRRFYRGFLYRRYYYIPLDNTYFIMQMIITFVILIIGAVAYIITYKTAVTDPLKDIKKTIINIHIAIILVLLGATIISSYISKNKKSLIKKLIAILSISIITLTVFIGLKIDLNSKYTRAKFEQIYEQEKTEKNYDGKTKINIGLTEMKMKDEKDYYVDEYIAYYRIFSIKNLAVIMLNILLNILLIYQILKVSKIQEKRDKLDKDDAILFDDEENIKI